jgi:hypothetical protein
MIASNGKNNSVQTDSFISLPNPQPAMLLGSMSHVFTEGGSAGEALFCIRVAVMGYSLHYPVSPSLLLRRDVPSHSNRTLPTFIQPRSGTLQLLALSRIE